MMGPLRGALRASLPRYGKKVEAASGVRLFSRSINPSAASFDEMLEFPPPSCNQLRPEEQKKKAEFERRRAGAPMVYASYSIQGMRPSMEDRYDAYAPHIDDDPMSIFGIFDGHAGSECAEYLSHVLIKTLVQEKISALPDDLEQRKEVIDNIFLSADLAFCNYAKARGIPAGSSALVAMIEREPVTKTPRKAWFANAGDSRAVVVRKSGRVKQLNRELSPELEDERERIYNEGGFVKYDMPFARDGNKGTLRVNGVLAMSRAFGNFSLKPFVTALPEITFRTLRKDDLYICMASDGLWEAVGNEDVADHLLQYGPRLGVEKLANLALKRGSSDNITIQAIGLNLGLENLPMDDD